MRSVGRRPRIKSGEPEAGSILNKEHVMLLTSTLVITLILAQAKHPVVLPDNPTGQCIAEVRKAFPPDGKSHRAEIMEMMKKCLAQKKRNG